VACRDISAGFVNHIKFGDWERPVGPSLAGTKKKRMDALGASCGSLGLGSVKLLLGPRANLVQFCVQASELSIQFDEA
jgi:hypothetical protein